MHDFAVLCPGQGSQTPTMFDLVAATREGRATIDQFAAAMGIDLIARARASDGLFENAFAQPAMVAAAMATWSALAPALPTPAAFAGYSVGEVSAWGCAGVWTVGRCAEIVALRARTMEASAPPGCGMIAVRNLSMDAIRRLAPAVDIAIVNGADHVILAGAADALAMADAALTAAGGATRRVDVRIPSHTPAMAEAADAFVDMTKTLSAARPQAPVLRGVDGLPMRRGDDAIPSLSRAIREPIRWDACMRTLAERGIRVALELGPGRSLTALAAACVPELVVRSVADFRTLEGVVTWLARTLEA